MLLLAPSLETVAEVDAMLMDWPTGIDRRIEGVDMCLRLIERKSEQ